MEIFFSFEALNCNSNFKEPKIVRPGNYNTITIKVQKRQISEFRDCSLYLHVAICLPSILPGNLIMISFEGHYVLD